MRIFKLRYILFITLSLSIFSSCNFLSNDTSSYSDDATITGFSIQYNDSAKYASTAVFTINTENHVIENVDSLPYGTRIDSLYPTITYESTSGFIVNDTLSYYSSITDAINFTDTVKITNVAKNGEAHITYYIKINVHQVDPYLYVWNVNNPYSIGKTVYDNQKAILFNNKILFYTGSSSAGNFLYTSDDGKTWDTETLSGLPNGVSFQNLDTFNTGTNTAYLVADKLLYYSTDGKNWTEKTTDGKYDFIGLLKQYNEQFYAIGQDKSTSVYYIIKTSNGTDWEQAEEMPANFPISDYSSTVFTPKIGYNKLIVVGGYNLNGEKLETRWATETGNYWVNLSNDRTVLSPIANAAMTFYGSQLLLVGGTKAGSNALITDSTQVRYSLDEGLHWTSPDTTEFKLPEGYTPRKSTSLVIKNQTLYIIGGNNGTHPLSDIWKVKINYYNFDPSEWTDY